MTNLGLISSLEYLPRPTQRIHLRRVTHTGDHQVITALAYDRFLVLESRLQSNFQSRDLKK